MNKLRQTFETALTSIDQFQREEAVRNATREFSRRLQYLLKEADEPRAVRKTVVYWEARAIRSYLHSDPETEFGITQKKRAEKYFARAQDAPGYTEDIALQYKHSCEAYDQIMGHSVQSEGGMLPSDIETFREIAP